MIAHKSAKPIYLTTRCARDAEDAESFPWHALGLFCKIENMVSVKFCIKASFKKCLYKPAAENTLCALCVSVVKIRNRGRSYRSRNPKGHMLIAKRK